MAVLNENGLRYAKLIHVSVDNGHTENSNKYYTMQEQSDGKIRCEYGRVGKTSTVIFKNSSEWDKLIREKTGKKGYKDVTDLISEMVVDKTTDKVDNVEIIKEQAVKELVRRLMAFANESIKQNYNVSQEAVTAKQVDEATRLVDDIVGLIKINIDIKTINNLLLELYQVIPRRMDNVKNYLLSNIDNDTDLQKALEFINNEKSTLDTMAGQVKLIEQQKEANENISDKASIENSFTILDQMGITMVEETNPKEINRVKEFLAQHAHKLHKVYRVVNHKTQKLFDENLAKSENKKVRLYWHGSRNRNWFNIIQTGLMIRPSGAGYNGSMFGDGIYYAREADKSMGYTDGGRWAGGSKNNFIYMALFDVHLGKQYVVDRHTSECSSLDFNKLQNKGKYDSTHAKKGVSLYRDEFIIYKKEQCTIKYLIELKN